MAAKYSNDNEYELQHNQRFSDIASEPLRILMPIQGYEKEPLVSLEKAIEPIVQYVPEVKRMAHVAKKMCKNPPADNLSLDESASIMLYSTDWVPREQCLYYVLNATLRSENRQKLVPWFLFLKLILTALARLPSSHRFVYRGIKGDIRKDYVKGSAVIWWGFSSCTSTMGILKNEQFLGSTGIRTFVTIECTSGKDIRHHSIYQREDEILLPPGRQFQVISCLNQSGDLYMIQLKEIEPPYPLLEPVSKDIEQIPSAIAATPLLMSQPISSPTPNITTIVEAMASLSSRQEYGVIILGNSGVGKSFLANILLGREAFVHRVAAHAVTTETKFEKTSMGNENYAIFNIPGLIEADPQRIEVNKREIDKAFVERPTSLILYVFGQQNGRIRDEDVVAFNALNKAYPLNFESLVLIVNGLAKDRPGDYEGEVIVLLEELTEVPCQNLCVLDMIDKNNEDERENLKNKLLQVIVERTPRDHIKKQDIKLQRDEVRKAKEEIKALQATFQQNKQIHETQIKEQQAKYDKMFDEIRKENEQMRRLAERQTEEQKQRDTAHQKAIQEANERAAQELEKARQEVKEANERAARELEKAKQAAKAENERAARQLEKAKQEAKEANERAVKLQAEQKTVEKAQQARLPKVIRHQDAPMQWINDPLSGTEKFRININIDGFDQNDVNLRVDGSKLLVYGEHIERKNQGAAKKVFEKSYELPRDIDTFSPHVTFPTPITMQVDFPSRHSNVIINDGRTSTNFISSYDAARLTPPSHSKERSSTNYTSTGRRGGGARSSFERASSPHIYSSGDDLFGGNNESLLFSQGFNSDAFDRSAFQPQIFTDHRGRKRIEMKLDVHNYEPNEIKVSINGNDLIVQAEQHVERRLNSSSRAYFYKQITLPPNTDLSSVTSKYNPDGTLHITANLSHEQPFIRYN